MCEMAAVSASKYRVEELTNMSMEVYHAMGHSLGIVALVDVGGKFAHPFYKAVTPEREHVRDFVSDWHDKAAMFIMHGRLATTGGVTRENAHPLVVDCEKCDVNLVLHNGIIRTHKRARKDHKQQGHSYETDVDSESIAHEFAFVPETFDAAPFPKLGEQPAIVLINNESVYMRTSRAYEMGGQGRFARTHRRFGPDPETDHREVILTPSPEGGDGA